MISMNRDQSSIVRKMIHSADLHTLQLRLCKTHMREHFDAQSEIVLLQLSLAFSYANKSCPIKR
jgi:hypothetical protein